MPELPEVETVARTLRDGVCGRRITALRVFNENSCITNPYDEVYARGSAAGNERRAAQGAVGGNKQGAVGGSKQTAAERDAARAARKKALIGQRIEAVTRRGKLLIMVLGSAGLSQEAAHGVGHKGNCAVENAVAAENLCAPLQTPQAPQTTQTPSMPSIQNTPQVLIFHLRMTGRLFLYNAGELPTAHTRFALTLDDGQQLFFDDARKFGSCRLLRLAELPQWGFWRRLGAEPFEMTQEEFIAAFSGRRRNIKSMLLDQEMIAGVGNIYADESLFRAGILPDAVPANWTKKAQTTRLSALRGALIEVLNESIAQCGSSIRDYRDAKGNAGAFQNTFYAYGRGGEACRVCGRIMEKTRCAGRGTSFCPHCQKA